MHKEQQQFCEYVKKKYPDYFKEQGYILDVGSLDINGNNRYLFEDMGNLNFWYKGVDLKEGKNVDLVMPVHEVMGFDNHFDVIISTECFEHDKHYADSLKNIIRMLSPGGLFLFTCATLGRREHGTYNRKLKDSPFTGDYYKNLTAKDILDVIPVKEVFSDHSFAIELKTKTLCFYGVKK